MPKPLLPGQWLRVVGLTVTLLLALLPAAPPTSAQDVPSETITVDGIKYTFDIHYENDTETLCVAAAEAPDIENIVVPDSILYDGSWYVVRSINFGYQNLTNLKSIRIPQFAFITAGTPFCYCPELEAINVADGNEHFLSIDGVLYSKDNIEGKGQALIKCPPKSRLTSVNIPSYISLIQSDAFADCINLTSIEIPNSVNEIWGNAFKGCTALESITIKGNLTELSDGIFNGCSNLKGFNIPATVTKIGGSTFRGCTSLKNLELPPSVTEIKANAFANCTSLISLAIPEGVAAIGYGTFMGCSSLEAIKLPSTLKSIDQVAFQGCSSLISIRLPEGLETLGYFTFDCCSALQSAEIPSTLEKIGPWAFNGCQSLSSVNIAEGVDSIGEAAFLGCEALAEINLPNSIHSIEDGAFRYCRGLKTITIPEGVETIGTLTFEDCTSLRSVSFPSSLRTLYYDAFHPATSNYDLLKSLTFNGITPPTILPEGGSLRWLSEDAVIYVPAESVEAYRAWTDYKVRAIGSIAGFEHNGLKYSVNDDGVTVELVGVIDGYEQTNVDIPGTISYNGTDYQLTLIRQDAFAQNSSLTSVSIPEGVTEIGHGAFSNTGLVSLTLPASLKQVGGDTFVSNNLTSVVFKGTEPPAVVDWQGNQCSLYFPNDNVTIYVPAEENIEAYKAIAGNYTVKALIIPDQPASKVWFDNTEINIKSGGEETATVAINIEPDDYDGDIDWTVSPNWVAEMTVADDNKSITLNPRQWYSGDIDVVARVTSADGLNLTASCKINVVGLEADNPIILRPGSTTKIEPRILPESFAEGFTFQFKSTDEGIASVDGEGNVTSIAPGNCSIEVKAVKDDEIFCSRMRDVTVVTELTTNHGSKILMKPGDQIRLLISTGVLDTYSEWTSDSPDIVEVTEDANILAKAEGTATLTSEFTLSDGTTMLVTCTVVVGKVSVGESFDVDGIIYNIISENTVEVIGLSKELTEISIPATISYEDMTFNITGIDDSAFSTNNPESNGSALTSVTLPEGLKTIGSSAFAWCENLVTVNIPSTVTTIGMHAFLNCSSLTSVKIAEGVQAVEEGAFAQCSALKSITFPASINSICGWILGNDYNLESIYFMSKVPPTVEDNDTLRSINEDVIIYVPAESVDDYKAWTNYTVMPIGSVVSDEFEYDGLRYRINKESETPSVELIGVVEGNTDANVTIPPTAVNGTEEYSVVGIAANAFADNQDIKSVEIPASVTSIGDGAFAGCDSLTVTMPGNNVTMGDDVFEGCTNLAVNVTPTEGGEGSENTTTLGTGFAGTPITEVTISEEITEIADGAFKGCTELTSIVIPDQVETIGASTFENCTSLQGVKLGSNVTTIAPDAFAGAEAITEVVCLSTTPPAFAVISRAFEGGFEQTVYDNATLIVPAGTEAAYKEAPIWKEFTKIQEVADVKVTVTVPEQVILFEGENFRLTPAFTPDLPDGYSVNYSSDRPYVATVGENGYISAVGAGVAGITVSVKDKNGNVVASATTNVAVGNDVSQLYDNVTIPVYRAMMVPLVLEPLDYLIGFMTCEAENPDIVTAYNNGSIYGNRVGETNLKMTFGLSEYSCKVKVVSEIRDIEIHTGNGTDIVPLGSPLKLFATTPDGDPVPVTWEMYSSSVASINYYTGEVTTAESGSCTIIARAVFDPELVAYYVLNVTDNPATGLTLDKSVLEMTEGETEQLTATATPANADAVIVWTSSDEAVATVGASTGEVTAVSAGTVTITATDAVTGINASCTVTVSKPSGIEVVDTAAISVRAESGRIIVKGAPADAAVEIFDMAGSRIALERGDCSVSVTAGIYVVRVAGTTIKVAVK